MDWTDLAFVRGQGAGSCEHGNESSGSIKFGEFPDKPMNYQLLRRDSACVIHGKRPPLGLTFSITNTVHSHTPYILANRCNITHPPLVLDKRPARIPAAIQPKSLQTQ